jgi:hypothetical protein
MGVSEQAATDTAAGTTALRLLVWAQHRLGCGRIAASHRTSASKAEHGAVRRLCGTASIVRQLCGSLVHPLARKRVVPATVVI